MSHDDNNRGKDARDRGAYTPPTDDDLPFTSGGFDARHSPASKAPPVTLIISAGVLLVLIIAVVLFYRSGLRASQDVPPAVGTPIAQLKVEAPVEAQPVDLNADVQVYRGRAEPGMNAPQFTPPPEAVQPRPAAKVLPPEPTELPVAPRPVPAERQDTAGPALVPRPVAPPAAEPAATQSGPSGTSAVQIGAYSSTAIADREYAAVAARFPQFSRGLQKRVQEVTAANGATVYRTTFYGLSRERAQAFCSAIRAAGDDCLVR
jgi:hypothetical protein